MSGNASISDAKCKKEHALWTEEIEVWKKDHARALHTLEEATSFVLSHEAELDSHLREVKEHEAMSEDEVDRAQTARERHLEVRHRHNSLRGRHRALIEEVLRLQVALHKAQHGKVF